MQRTYHVHAAYKPIADVTVGLEQLQDAAVAAAAELSCAAAP
jgi:hypothetical protein